MGSKSKQQSGRHCHHLHSFFLGALLPCVFFFFLASDKLGDRLSSLGYGALPPAIGGQAPGANLTSDSTSALAADEKQEQFPGLAELLAKVAMEDKTVIITSVNEAWAKPGSLLDLFLDSFKNGERIEHLLKHLLIVSVDIGGFNRCKAIHPHCFLIEVKSIDVSSANRYMSKPYLELVWTKLSLQQRVLKLGYNFLFSDCDMVWFRDPFRHISMYADMSISCDKYSGDPDELKWNAPNTGFYYVKSTNRAVEMLKHWQASRSRFPIDNHDQHIFGKIKREIAGKLQRKLVFLDTALFGGFCQHRHEMDKVCTMHAICCIGLENKLHDLRLAAADWKNYTSLPPEEKESGNFTWTYPSACRRSIGRH